MSTENKCLFYGNRVVIPGILRHHMLDLLQEAHVGVVKMKALTRSYVRWPGINQDIELFIRSCKVCQTCQRGKKQY